MNKFLKTALRATIAFFVLIWLMSGKISYGLGLGGLFVFYVQIAWVVLLLIALNTLKKRTIPVAAKYVWFFSFLLFLSACLTIYSFTFGRGSVFPWNGEIFIR